MGRAPLATAIVLGAAPFVAAGDVDLSSDTVRSALACIRPEALRAHVGFLADDLLEGRGTATRGYEIAARYVAAQFEALGLAPGGVEGGYFQPVPLVRSALVPQRCSLSLVRGSAVRDLAAGRDYVMATDALRAESEVSAPVSFVGYGVTAPELKHDDYAGVDVRGRIVAMLSGAPAGFPHNQRAYHSSRSLKEATAVAHGAIGVLTMTAPSDEKRVSWERVVRRYQSPGFRWLEQGGAPHDVRSEIRGTASLSRSGAEALFAGAPRPAHDVFVAVEAGGSQSLELPVEVRIRKATEHARVASPNVVGILRGSDPRLAGEYVVYSAHLDHLGLSEPVDGDAINNGAYDNASGTAFLIEIARAFAGLPHPPRRSIVFLATTGEEQGLLGADYFAHHPTVPREALVADVNMDEYLTLYRVADVVAYGAEHSSLGPIVERAAALLGLEVSPDPFPEEVSFVRSDNYPFVEAGVPAVSLFPGFKSANPELDGSTLVRSWLRDVYHTPKDEAGQPMDLPSFVDGARLHFLIGYAVAQETARPRWNPGDFFGRTFGRR